MFNFTSILMAGSVLKNLPIPNLVGMTYEGKQGACITLMVFLLLFAIGLIVAVMMQQGTDNNVTAITGKSESYYGKNKAMSKEGILKKITLVLFCLIMMASIIFFVISLVDINNVGNL